MILFAALCAGLAAACFVFKLSAEAGAGRAIRQRREQQNATPPHTYTAHDGSQGRWP